MLWGKKNKNVINLNGVKRNITIQIFASHSHEEPRTNNCYIIYSENPFPFLFNCIFSFISMPTFPTFVFFVILSLFFVVVVVSEISTEARPNSKFISNDNLEISSAYAYVPFLSRRLWQETRLPSPQAYGFGGLILEIRSCSC